MLKFVCIVARVNVGVHARVQKGFADGGMVIEPAPAPAARSSVCESLCVYACFRFTTVTVFFCAARMFMVHACAFACA